MYFGMIMRGLLVLLVVVTSQQMALLRGQTQPVGVAVFCLNETTTEVPIGPDGAPVSYPHICPDCALNVIVALEPPQDTCRHVTGETIAYGFEARHVQPFLRVLSASARGPPQFG